MTIGCSEVGKTSIISRYTTGQFDNHLSHTIGVDFVQKTIKLKPDKKIIL